MSRRTMTIRISFQVALAAVVGAVLSGCSGGSDLPLVSVSGRVTFDGGPPPQVGTVSFAPVPGTGREGLPIRPATASFDTDGSFVAASFRKGDGLLPGKYQVTIVCLAGDPGYGPGQSHAELSFVPLDYRPGELVVEEGSGPIVVNYDVPPKKK